jgi:antitoxin MazE
MLYIGMHTHLPGAAERMRKKLSPIGNSLGVVIERPILELLAIRRDTELEMTTDGDRLILTPVRTARRRRINGAARRVMDANDTTFRKLAT